MKNRNIKHHLLKIITIVLISINACHLYDDPVEINNPPAYPSSPVISRIEPVDSSVAGIREITIIGQNFSTALDQNTVYFNKVKGIIKSISNESIVVYRPNLTSDTIKILVRNQAALSMAEVENYKIKNPGGAFPSDLTPISDQLYALEVDKDENLYIASRRKIFKVIPDGTLSEFVETPSSLARFTDLKVGPDGFIYFTIQNKKTISRINLTTHGSAETYATVTENVERIDFDQNGNIYAGQKKGLFIVRRSDKSIIPTGLYNGMTILEIRVFNNSVYVADSKSISKNIINADGTLGSIEPLINLNDFPAFQSCDISSFNFDTDGMIFLCLKDHPDYSLFVFENGSIVPYYFDNILPTQADQIVWGTGKYLYLNRGLTVEDRTAIRIYRMGTFKNGAPYLGRQ